MSTIPSLVPRKDQVQFWFNFIPSPQRILGSTREVTDSGTFYRERPGRDAIRRTGVGQAAGKRPKTAEPEPDIAA